MPDERGRLAASTNRRGIGHQNPQPSRRRSVSRDTGEHDSASPVQGIKQGSDQAEPPSSGRDEEWRSAGSTNRGGNCHQSPQPRRRQSVTPRTYRVLLLCSGPTSRTDSLAKLLAKRGISATEVDVINVELSDQNLLDDSTWQRIKDDLAKGVYDFIFASPPCRTFSEARSEPGGPPVLRDHKHPYGYPKSQARERSLKHAHFEQLREDNLLADRVAHACQLITDAGGGYAVEQPFPWKGSVCMFELPSFKRLLMAHQSVVFDQCRYGQSAAKPTEILYHQAKFAALAAKCNHPNGHPPLKGKDSRGEFRTKALAAYPSQLNESIAEIIADAVFSGLGPS